MDLSIIIPVYNVNDYLEFGFKKLLPLYHCLDEKSFEILYINDGSPDNSQITLEKISKRKNNIRIISQTNQGLSGARNTGIRNANGRFIGFLDADDYLDIKKFKEVLDIAQNNNLDLTGYRLQHVNINHEIIKSDNLQNVSYNKINDGQNFLKEGYAPNSSCLFIYKTNFLKANKLYFIRDILHEDEEFTSKVMFYAQKVIFTDIFAYFYLQRSGSIIRPTDKLKLEKLLADEIIVATFIREYVNKTDDIILQKSITKNYNSIIWNLMWYLIQNKTHLDKNFIHTTVNDLKKHNLYPIKGPLKTKFQKISRTFMNIPFILNHYLLQ